MWCGPGSVLWGHCWSEFFFGDSAGFWRLFSAGLIVIGVIGLKIAH